MSFKVFLSYSVDADEQPIVWRLQTLAATHGIEVFVPQRQGFRLPSTRAPLLSESVRSAIDRSDCVLAIITARTGAAVQKELNYALGKRKIIIPLVQDSIKESAFLEKFPRVFRFSPLQPPGKIETEVVGFLKQQKASKEAQQVLGAVIAIGLSMLLLSAASQE